MLQYPFQLTLAGALLGRNDRKSAISMIKEARQKSEENRDALSEAWAIDMLGDLFRRNLNAIRALDEHKTSHSLVKSQNLGLYEEVRSLVSMGADLASLRDDREAERVLKEAESLARRNDLLGLLAQCLLYLGWVASRGGREQESTKALREALRLAEQQENLHFFLQEASVAIPIYALADRVGAGAFLRGRIIPRLDPKLQKYFHRLSSGGLYPTDVELGPPRMPRLNSPSEKNEVDDARLAKVKLLTAREIDILRLVTLGMPNKKVGDELFITEKTVKTHTHHIFRKLGVTSRWQAAIIFQDYLKGAGRLRRGQALKEAAKGAGGSTAGRVSRQGAATWAGRPEGQRTAGSREGGMLWREVGSVCAVGSPHRSG